MKSMTGFGTGRVDYQDGTIEVSMKTVNGRFLEARFHLPREFSLFENDLKKILSSHIHRGTVDIYIHRKISQEKKYRLVLNQDLAGQYLKSVSQLQKKFKLTSKLQADHVLRFPEVVHLVEESGTSEGEKKVLEKLFKTVCQSCVKEREREGKNLQQELKKILQSLDDVVEKIQWLREDANRSLAQKIQSKIQSRLQEMNLALDSQRISQEVVMQLEKSDINEEIARLKEHLRSYHTMLETKGEIGKKLDFYTQELLREMNTIGSKSQIAKLTQLVVEAKTLIEQLREQVQNVE